MEKLLRILRRRFDRQQKNIVPITEDKLLLSDRDVINLFRSDPFGGPALRCVRAVMWQYWFTTINQKRRTGNWWTRKFLGLYAPAIERTPDGRFAITAPADELPRTMNTESHGGDPTRARDRSRAQRPCRRGGSCAGRSQC